MAPILRLATMYDDVIPTLSALKRQRYKMALISNTPWGSPAYIWREHLQSLKLNEFFDATIFCRDVGWRKPARQIFEFALKKVRITPRQCLFVGDDPRWDVLGPINVGTKAVLIVRDKTSPLVHSKTPYIRHLDELLEMSR